jgi:hypothetical protein
VVGALAARNNLVLGLTGSMLVVDRSMVEANVPEH